MIAIITSGQPSLNPRLVKEADALANAGYEVVVIYQYWNDWGTNLDQELLAGKKWKAILVGGSPLINKAHYLKSRLSFKLAKFLTQKIGFKNSLAERAIGRCTPLLIKKAKMIKADLYISHNLAALPAAVLAAKKNKAKCGFDAEDFHRNEVTDDSSAYDVRLKTYIEDKYIKQLDYLSTASPLISLAYSQLYQSIKPTTILNTFPKQKLIKRTTKNRDKIKLFWFSQTIGNNRGLENIIKALGLLKNIHFELHLLGNHNEHIKKYFYRITIESGLNHELIYYYSPIPADNIYTFASQFDIGLATEMTIPNNRNICLTNKIFTYVQAGIAILASNTAGQQRLMEEYPEMGLIYDQFNIEDLAFCLKKLADNHELITEYQRNAANYGSEVLNWETERSKFLSLISTQIHST